MSVYRRMANADRFDNYREIRAKFDSTGKCGHAIKEDDLIGWNKRHGVYCTDCWFRWKAENAAADADERFLGVEPDRGMFGEY